MQNPNNPNNPKPEVPPRATNYPVPTMNNGANDQMFNNKPQGNNGPMFNNKPPIVPQRTNVSVVPNQAQQFQILSQNNQRAFQNSQVPPPPVTRQTSSSTPANVPPRQTPVNTRTDLPPPPPIPPQYSNHTPTPANNGGAYPSRNNTSSSSNVQVNMPQNMQHRRANSQKEFPSKPEVPKKSNLNIYRSASQLRTKFVDMVKTVPSLGRTFSTRRRQEKVRRLSKFGGMNVHTAYRNSLMVKPKFENDLLLKPQNPNFIISIGIIVMIAAVSLSIAIVALTNGGLSEVKIHDISSEDSYGFIFFSMFMVLIATTGCISYYKKWTPLLITYAVFIIFGFIVQLIIISLFLNIYFHPVVQMRNKWVDVLTIDEKSTIQEDYQCCGFLSVIDHGETSSMCFPDTGSTTLPVKSGKALMNTINYLDLPLRKRQDPGAPADNGGAAADNGGGAADNGGAAAPAGNGGAGAAAGGGAAANTTNSGAAGAGAPAAGGALSDDAQKIQDLKKFYKLKDPNSYTMEDVKEEGCANIIIKAVKTGLLQYILIEVLMAFSFVAAFYFAYIHFREQLDIENEIDSARATFG